MKDKQIKFGIILTYIIGIFQILVNVFMTGALVRFLGDIEYGLYIMLGSLAAYVSIFDFGLNNTISRYIAKYRAENDREKESNLLFISLSFYILISVIILILGFMINTRLTLFIPNIAPEYIGLAKTLFLLLIINIAITLPINSFSAILVGYERFVFTKTVSLLRILAIPVLSVPCLYFGGSSVTVVVVTAVTNLFAGILNAYYSIRKCGIKIKLYYYDKVLVKEIILYSFFIFIGIISDQLFYNAGNIVLGIVKGPENVTLFGVSMQLTQYLVAIAAAFTGVYLPKATMIVLEKTAEISDFFSKISRNLAVVLLCVLFGYLTVGREFIYFWLEDKLNDVYVVSLIIIVPTIWTLTRTLGLSIVQAMNKHKFRSILLLIRSVFCLIVSYFAARAYGSYGVAICYAGCIIVTNLILDFYYEREVGISVFKFSLGLLPLLVCSVAASAAAYMTYLVLDYSLPAFLLRGIIYLAVFFLLLYKFFLLRDEKDKIRNVLIKALRR